MSANKNSSSKKDDLANLDSTQIATKTKAESVMSMVQSFEQNESFLVGQGIKSKSKAIHSSRLSDASSHHTKTLKNNQTKQETKRRHVIGPTFKSRNDDFHKIFTSVSPSEKIISDYSCALQLDILFHGRMYISENHLGFYVYLFRKETKILIKWIDVIKIKREKTAKLIPNAILLVTHSDKYCFTSLAMRDKTFLLMRELWQNSFSNYKLTNVDLWLWRYYNYGDELGLNDEADSNRSFSRSISQNDGSSADCKKISSSPTIYDEGADDSLRFKVTALDRSQFYCRVQKQLKLLQLEATNKINGEFASKSNEDTLSSKSYDGANKRTSGCLNVNDSNNNSYNKEKENNEYNNNNNLHNNSLQVPIASSISLDDNNDSSRDNTIVMDLNNVDDSDINITFSTPQKQTVSEMDTSGAGNNTQATQRSPSPLMRLKKNNLWNPLKKSRSKSFEPVKILVSTADTNQQSQQQETHQQSRQQQQHQQQFAESQSSNKTTSAKHTSKCSSGNHSDVFVDEAVLKCESVSDVDISKMRNESQSSLQTFKDLPDIVTSDEKKYDSGRESECACLCGHHMDLKVLTYDDLHDCTAYDLFKRMFQKSDFWFKWLKFKKAKDVVLSPWSAETDNNGARVRNIAYTVCVNHPLGLKHSPTNEKQILYSDSSPGEFYLVDTECTNNGLPYSEDFYIVNRYCISKISDSKCRLRITSQVKYKRKLMGLIRSFIEKNATSGIIETFSVMGHLLKQESNMRQNGERNVQPPIVLSSRKKSQRRRPFDKLPLFKSSSQASSDDEKFKDASSTVTKVVGPSVSEQNYGDDNDCNDGDDGDTNNGNQNDANQLNNNNNVAHRQNNNNYNHQNGHLRVREATNVQREKETFMAGLALSTSVKIITAFAFFLLLFNVFLFLKLNELENLTIKYSKQMNIVRRQKFAQNSGGKTQLDDNKCEKNVKTNDFPTEFVSNDDDREKETLTFKSAEYLKTINLEESDVEKKIIAKELTDWQKMVGTMMQVMEQMALTIVELKHISQNHSNANASKLNIDEDIYKGDDYEKEVGGDDVKESLIE